ncbi:MAG: ABC transporter permease [Ktedonobacterales bacterium]
MKRGLRIWFYAEAIIGALATALFVVTLFTRDWIEMVFHVDPDSGSGYVEWLVVAGLLVVALVCGYLARREWIRASVAAA